MLLWFAAVVLFLLGAFLVHIGNFGVRINVDLAMHDEGTDTPQPHHLDRVPWSFFLCRLIGQLMRGASVVIAAWKTYALIST